MTSNCDIFTEKTMSRIKDKLTRALNWIKSFFAVHPALLVLVLSYSITFANEAMLRRSLWAATVFLFTKPIMFLCNMVIVAAFEALALLSRKRVFWLWFFSLVWLGLGVTNFILLFSRITPFAAKDFILMRTVFTIVPNYLGWFGTALAALALVGVIISLIVAYFRTAKRPVKYLNSALIFFVTVTLTLSLIGGGFLFNLFPDHFPSLPIAYEKYGFNFCFTVGMFDSGIAKPKDYEDKIDDLVSDLLGENSGSEEPVTPVNTPNVIFVQLESFYDLDALKGFTFSQDIMPNFTRLKDSCMSGILTVPSIGAGTANTEFEILSGMSMSLFGMGEYPYESVLQKQACESICFILEPYGYTSHAIHNYKGYFYSRNIAFSSLGFNTFTSLEYMHGVKKNALDWAHDDVLLPCISECLSSTEGPDFIQCVTVQGHGKYPSSPYSGEENDPMELLEYPKGASYYGYKYLANQIYQTDAFVGNLISLIQARGEETVVVFYGDHIPNLGIQEEWLPEGMTLYSTEYVIWKSDGIAEEDKSFTSYQMSSEVLGLLGIEGGMMPTLHRSRGEKDEALYKLDIHMLQYDLLYGDCVSYGGKLPFKRTDLKMGVHDITVTDVYSFGENVYVKGTAFTEYSKIFVNGIMRETEYIDPQTLILSDYEPKDGDSIKIIQVTDLIFHISSTEEFIYESKTEEQEP